MAEEKYPHNWLVLHERIGQFCSFYKFPLILGGIGTLLLICAIGLQIKDSFNPKEVVFENEATASSKTRVRVDIAGAVVKPGVYEFNEGDRIEDALSLAGGLSIEADVGWIEKNLNRAAKLTDGGKIYIPKKAEISSGKSLGNINNAGSLSSSTKLLGVATENTVNINSASQAELETLSGIGPVTAGKIINGRPYSSVEELKSRKIIGNALYEKIKDLLTVY